MYSDHLLHHFRQHFGAEPALLVRAPGRVNLIGEHTDYNDGFVLPAAIDKAIWLALSPRTDGRLEFVAQDFGERFSGQTARLEKSAQGWPDYLLGVVDELQKLGLTVPGFNLVLGGDIPAGAGLSSSAAVESGLALALNELGGYGLLREDLARLAQRAENRFVGIQCGIMDMFASLHGQQHSALQLDCRDLHYRLIPVELGDFTLVLANSGVKHALVNSEYNTRRQECEQGVELLQTTFPGVKSLRDVSLDQLLSVKNTLPEVIFRRCRHVVSENERVLRAGEVLTSGDVIRFGQLLYASHDSLRDDYAVSCAELDFLVEQARANPAVAGARMVGGGFGGCTLNLLRRDAGADFQQHTAKAYRETFGLDLIFYAVEITDGAAVLTSV